MEWNSHVEDWVTNLRNGNYLQTRAVLKRNNVRDGRPGFCCLGVTCDMAGVELMPSLNSEEMIYGWFNGTENMMGEIPDWLMDFLTLDGQDVYRLTRLNDGSLSYGQTEKSFEEIADVIEYAAKNNTSINAAAQHLDLYVA